MKLHSRRPICCWILLHALATVTLRAELPPEAQAAFNKGVIAAKVPDYLLAIRYFDEARKLAPAAPVIFFNLGLAESKIPGRELRAIAWFGAYLAASPETPNAGAMRAQISELEIRSQSNLARLIRAVQEAVGRLPWGRQNNDYKNVAHLWAKTGDTASALRIIDLTRGEHKGTILATIVGGLAEAGDIAGAQEIAALFTAYVPPDPSLDKSLAEANSRWINKVIAEARRRADDSSHLIVLQPSDWISRLDDRNPANSCPLGSAPFLDLPAHLQSLGSDDPSKFFDALKDTADRLITAHIAVIRMLQQPVRPSGKPQEIR